VVVAIPHDSSDLLVPLARLGPLLIVDSLEDLMHGIFGVHRLGRLKGLRHHFSQRRRILLTACLTLLDREMLALGDRRGEVRRLTALLSLDLSARLIVAQHDHVIE